MLVICLILVVGAGMAHSADFLSQVMKFGAKGDPSSGGDNLIEDVYFDGRGNVYFADRNNYKILKYNAKGERLMSFGKFGAANGRRVVSGGNVNDPIPDRALDLGVLVFGFSAREVGHHP